MIISDEEVSRRLNSPMNLMNRLKGEVKNSSRRSAMELFTKRKQLENIDKTVSIQPSVAIPEIAIPSETTTTLDAIIQNHESQIKLGLAHDKAIDLLNNSVNLLATKLDDVKASSLPQVIKTASEVIDRIRRERTEAHKTDREREVHYHFYTPQQRKIEEYEVIEVQ